MRRQSSSSRSVLWILVVSTVTSFSSSTPLGADVGQQLEHRLHVADPRTLERCTGSVASTQAARIGSAPFLFPAAPSSR